MMWLFMCDFCFGKTLTEHRKLPPVGSSHVGIHRTYTCTYFKHGPLRQLDICVYRTSPSTFDVPSSHQFQITFLPPLHNNLQAATHVTPITRSKCQEFLNVI